MRQRTGEEGKEEKNERAGGFTLREGEVGRNRAFFVCVCMESGRGGRGFKPSFFPPPSQISYVFKSSRMSPFRGLSGASVRFVCDFFCTSAAMYVVGLSVPVCMCVSACLMIPSFLGAGPVQKDQRERKSEERRSKSEEKERGKESKRKKREEARQSKNCVSRR